MLIPQVGNMQQNNVVDLVNGISGGGANPIEGWNGTTEIANYTLTNATLTSRKIGTGSGWIKTIFGGVGTTCYIALKIDGAYVIGSSTQGKRLTTSDYYTINKWRYTTSFEIFSSFDNVSCWYNEGDDYKEATPAYYTYDSSGSLPTLRKTLTGSGWVNNIDYDGIGGSGDVTIIIDSVTVIDATKIASGPILCETYYNTGVSYYCTNVDIAMIYQQE